MQDQITSTLTRVFSEVLSDLAFMFRDEEPAEASDKETWLETTIAYSGVVSGTLRLRCTRGFASHLAANLLGTGPGEGTLDSTSDDAVKEFMNTVCGQFVTAEHGTKEVFTLTIPQIRRLPTAPNFNGNDEGDSSCMTVEGHPVQLTHLEPAN